MISIQPGMAADAAALEALLDLAFGPERHKKTVYRLRAGVSQIEGLWFVARAGEALVGSVQYWPVRIAPEDGGAALPAVLLGPIAIAPALRGLGIGQALIETSLAVAASLGHVQVLLVGDEPYYSRMGFSARATLGLSLPGPYDPRRLLARQIALGPALPAAGAVLAAFPVPGEAEKPKQQPQRRPRRQQGPLAHPHDPARVVGL
ncbi:MAG: GNAT family N-acetyltransferase [Pseudomonadota bacterium]